MVEVTKEPRLNQKEAERPVDLLAGESITRFDKNKKKRKKKK